MLAWRIFPILRFAESQNRISRRARLRSRSMFALLQRALRALLCALPPSIIYFATSPQPRFSRRPRPPSRSHRSESVRLAEEGHVPPIVAPFLELLREGGQRLRDEPGRRPKSPHFTRLT